MSLPANLQKMHQTDIEEGATVIYRVPGSTDSNNRPTPSGFDKKKTSPDKSIPLRGGRVALAPREYRKIFFRQALRNLL